MGVADQCEGSRIRGMVMAARSERADMLIKDQYFMKIARLAATRSKDNRTQVGACIVDVKEDRIISTGYNGFPWKCPDDEFPWAKNEDKERNELDPQTKDPYVCHAEYNAIINKGAADITGEDIVLYTTLYPCENCALLIIHSGIKRVKYAEIDKKKFEKSIELFKAAEMDIELVKADSEHTVSLKEEDYSHILAK